MPTAHAILAPSGAARWMACTPSARLESTMPKKDTAYTREGTIAHSMAETLLRIFLDQGDQVPEDFSEKFRISYNSLRGKNGELPGMFNTLAAHCREAEAEGLDPFEMLDTVLDRYARLVWEDFMTARQSDPDAILDVEVRLKLDEFIPEGFGSSDAVIIGDDTLAVYDLKYGKGVKVSAKGNAQMRCYALGAWCGPGELYDLKNVRMTIIQPRLDWVSVDELPVADLLDWAGNELKPAAVLAYQGIGDFNPGTACRFCAAAPKCKALAKKAAEYDTRDVADLMTNGEISEALKHALSLKAYAATLENYTLQRAMEGETFPGFKVVEGRSLRQISDQGAAMATLAKAGFPEDAYIKPKELKTITDLERLLKKKGFQELLGQYVIKPQGKPTLVEDTDPRPAMSTADSAKNDFKNIIK